MTGIVILDAMDADVVGEEPGNECNAICRLATKSGYEFSSFRDPEAVLDQLRRFEPPVLAFVGVGGGDVRSLGGIRRLRSQYPWPSLVIIAVVDSAHVDSALPRAVDAGADGFLTKPVQPSAFELCVRSFRRLSDLHGKACEQQELRFLATHDPLTLTWNKRALTGHLYRELARAIRRDSNLCVVMCDADHFKRVNDTFGHLVGDEILKQLAPRLTANVRSYDILGRYGGEEFVVLLPACELDLGTRIAERLRSTVSQRAFSTSAGPVALTMSVGVADLRTVVAASTDKMTTNALLDAADRALYAAKRAGRDRVRVYDTCTQAASGLMRAVEP